MNDEYRKRWLPLVAIVIALLAWSAMLGLGAFLQLGGDPSRTGFGRPLAIFASMCVFLAFWGLALWFRARRK